MHVEWRGGGEIDAVNATSRDMAAWVSTQADQLKDVDRQLRELVSNVAHDLRTPLCAAQGCVETVIVRPELSGEDRRRYLDDALSHLARLDSLVCELFELSKLEERDAALVREPFPLAELVQDTAIGLRLSADAKNIDLAVDVGSSPVSAIGDMGLVQRALENLIRNAIQYTPHGGRVEVGLAERGDSIVVRVEDDGPGIPEEDLSRVFDRFYRVTADCNGNAAAGGLGLAIVKRIMELHGTRIAVASQMGVGTRFEFPLPSCHARA